MLFVHGGWHGAWCWDEKFLPYFAQQGYEAHALSLRGHGQSYKTPVRWVSGNDYVTDVITIASQLSSPPVVIGHSMGGYVVQKYLETQFAPAAILCASSAPRPAFSAIMRLLRQAFVPFLKSNLIMDLYPLVSTPALAQKFLFSDHMPADEVAAYQSRLQSESYRVMLDASLLNWPNPKRVQTAVFVLGAANDSIITRSEVEYTARVYNTQATILPNIAHNMMLDPNWQAAADAIISWLQQHIP